MKIDILEENISKHFKFLEKIGNLGNNLEDGFLRASWSEEEENAVKYFEEKARDTGLETFYDKIGNLFALIPGEYENLVLVGSHLDTVPSGGNFDGVVGVVAGFEAVKEIHQRGLQTSKGAGLVIFRGEESATYDYAYKGSKAAFGIAKKDITDNKFTDLDGKTHLLRNEIKKRGYDPQIIEGCVPSIDDNLAEKLEEMIELHIEQANKLEKDRKDTGIVTSIRGNIRYLVEVSGEFDHSGATPMGTGYRRDANLAIAYMLLGLDSIRKDCSNQGRDIVQTVGQINSDKKFNADNTQVYDNSLTKVSGYGYFKLDVRSNSSEFLQEYNKKVIKIIEGIAESFNVEVEIHDLGASDPLEELDKGIQSTVEQVCKNRGYSYEYMISGAGHDVAVVAQQKGFKDEKIKGGLIFIPCRRGKSHSKDEYASIKDITRGVNVIANTLYERIR